jgi:integrative and conjugative element protein (TIGR02256 family)
MNPVQARRDGYEATLGENVKCPVTVTVTDTCRAAVSRYAATAEDGRETGGILLGHHRERPRPILDAVHAGDAGPRAVRQAAAFRRDVQHAQALADLAYRTDGSVWIGEWHTHPSGPPRPSRRDLTSYRRLLRDPELAFQAFLSMIILPSRDCGLGRPNFVGWVVTTADAWPVPLLRRAHLERTGL